MNNYLHIGDVFSIVEGDVVYAKIPEKFVYVNSKKGTLTDHDIKVGESLKSSYYPKEIMYTYDYVGDYVVTSAIFTGGGGGMGMNGYESYSDGWKVYAKKLKNGKWDDKGLEISFYQSGSFTAMIKRKIPVIKRMKLKFV